MALRTKPLKRKRAERTANSCLRNSKALFGKRIIRQLRGVDLPEEIPFREVEYFRQTQVFTRLLNEGFKRSQAMKQAQKITNGSNGSKVDPDDLPV